MTKRKQAAKVETCHCDNCGEHYDTLTGSVASVKCHFLGGVCFSEEEAEQLFRKKVSPKNLDMLLAHICDDDVAPDIMAFFEIDGVIHFIIGEMVAVRKFGRANYEKPLIHSPSEDDN